MGLLDDIEYLMNGQEVRVIFDVGANRGDSATEYLQRFTSAEIHCFEPGPQQLEKLKKRFHTQNNVHIHDYAVSDSSSTSLFHCNRDNPTDSLLATAEEGTRWCDGEGTGIETQYSMQVNTITLDEFCRNHQINRIDILKLDVQGAELMAIQGADGLLENQAIGIISAELLFVPVYKNQPYFYEICRVLARYGYMLINLYNYRYDEQTPQLKWADGLFINRGWETSL